MTPSNLWAIGKATMRLRRAFPTYPAFQPYGLPSVAAGDRWPLPVWQPVSGRVPGEFLRHFAAQIYCLWSCVVGSVRVGRWGAGKEPFLVGRLLFVCWLLVVRAQNPRAHNRACWLFVQSCAESTRTHRARNHAHTIERVGCSFVGRLLVRRIHAHTSSEKPRAHNRACWLFVGWLFVQSCAESTRTD